MKHFMREFVLEEIVGIQTYTKLYNRELVCIKI